MVDVTQYISKEAAALVPVIYFFGYILKKSPYVKDWLIPYILIFISILFSVTVLGFTPQAFIQGVLVVAVSILGNQLWKQTLEGVQTTKEE